MGTIEIIEALFALFAGIGIFLVACKMMSNNLEAVSSSKHKALFAYCDSTGLLAGESCNTTYDGWFKKDRVPEVCDGVHPPKKPIVEEETEGDEISSDLSSTEDGANETPDTETSSTNSEVTE